MIGYTSFSQQIELLKSDGRILRTLTLVPPPVNELTYSFMGRMVSSATTVAKSRTAAQSSFPMARATPGMASLHFFIRGRYLTMKRVGENRLWLVVVDLNIGITTGKAQSFIQQIHTFIGGIIIVRS
jgi:hypothetical protein